jgi:hypothetical protein
MPLSTDPTRASAGEIVLVEVDMHSPER